MKSSIFLLNPPFRKEGTNIIRLCIPGIDQGGAVWLEAEIEGNMEYCQEILKKVHAALPEVVIEEQ